MRFVRIVSTTLQNVLSKLIIFSFDYLTNKSLKAIFACLLFIILLFLWVSNYGEPEIMEYQALSNDSHVIVQTALYYNKSKL